MKFLFGLMMKAWYIYPIKEQASASKLKRMAYSYFCVCYLKLDAICTTIFVNSKLTVSK